MVSASSADSEEFSDSNSELQQAGGSSSTKRPRYGEPDNDKLLPDDMNLQTPLIVSDFCLVKFLTEEDQQTKYYIGQIIQLHHEAYEFSFLRRIKNNSLTFSFPQVPDVTTVPKNDVIQRVLPLKRGGTARQNRHYTFKFEEPPNLY